MTSSLANQPGGCCCTIPGWYDVYDVSGIAGSLAPAGKIVRFATLRPNGVISTTSSADATNGIDWFIPWYTTTVPANNLTGTYCGFPAFGTKYWSVETHGSLIVLVQYDASSKTTLQTVTIPFSNLSAGQGLINSGTSATGSGTSQDSVLHYQRSGVSATDGLYIIQNGTLSYSPAHGESTTVVQNIGFQDVKTTVNSVDCIAWQDAPVGAGSETITHTFGTTTNQHTDLYIGNLSVNSQGILVCEKNVVYSSPDQFTILKWITFDHSPTQWAGIIYRQTVGHVVGTLQVQPSQALQLLINGVLVKEIVIPNDQFFIDLQTMMLNYFSSPHVCHPHETLGDGWVAVPQKIYTSDGTAYEDPDNPWKVVVYKDGGEAWRTPAIWNQKVPTIRQSSDRWLYIPDEAVYQGSVPASIKNPTPFDHFSHDGTYQFRGGNLTTDGTDTIKVPNVRVDQFHPAPWVISGGTAVVRNSAAVGNSLPAVFPPPH